MSSIKQMLWVIGCLLWCSLVGISSASAQEKRTIGIPALPGEPCQTKPLSSWTPQEKWVWERVCEGEVADFNEAKGGELDPKQPDGWPEKRVLRPAFLETILLHEPFRSAVPRHGVRILGAWFKEKVDLSDGDVIRRLWLDKSRFDEGANFIRLRTSSLISLVGSKFSGELNMQELQVGDDLFMRDKAEFAEVTLVGARVGGELDMSKSQFAEVTLVGARVGENLAMSSSKFSGKLNMQELQVERILFMDEEAEFAEVILLDARVGGQLQMQSCKFSGKLDMTYLQVEGTLFMHGKAEFSDDVSLIFANIGGNVFMFSSTFGDVDLTGTQVRGELHLGSTVNPAPTWRPNAILNLRNTQVGTIQDLLTAWPPRLELTGFTYSRLGGYTVPGDDNMTSRDVSWLTGWLEKQARYSPQPYEQLAKVLRQAGHAGKATAILYAGRKREWGESKGFRWLRLCLENVFIGYGYHIEFLLYWCVGFIVAGAIVLWRSGQGKANNLGLGIAYSVDMLLPIIQLRQQHYTLDWGGWARGYFFIHQLMGYVMASFLIVGAAGWVK